MSRDTPVVQIAVLTRGATFTALALALIAFQYSAPGSFILLTWLVPLVFACAGAYLPVRVIALVLLGAVGGSLVVFGIVTALWALFYAFYGCVVGIVYRLGWPPIARILIGGIIFWGTLQGVILTLIVLLGSLSAEIRVVFDALWQQYYLLLSLPLLIIAFINALVTSRMIGKVFQRLSMTVTPEI